MPPQGNLVKHAAADARAPAGDSRLRHAASLELVEGRSVNDQPLTLVLEPINTVLVPGCVLAETGNSVAVCRVSTTRGSDCLRLLSLAVNGPNRQRARRAPVGVRCTWPLSPAVTSRGRVAQLPLAPGTPGPSPLRRRADVPGRSAPGDSQCAVAAIKECFPF